MNYQDWQSQREQLEQDEAPFDWASLESHVRPDGTFAPPTKQSSGPYAKTQDFPCTACGGSGRWLGGVNRYGNSKCRACGGKGSFKTSEADRRAAKVKRDHDKAVARRDACQAFEEQYPGLMKWVQEAASWSSFCFQMIEAAAQYGTLTEGQAQACIRMRAKCEQRREERAREKVAGSREIDLAVIKAMFDAAVASGYKKPIYRAAGLVISRAPDHGRNPGALYVTSIEDDSYLGKIIGTQYTGKPAPGLEEIAADPKAAAIRYGQRTGRCSCCGRLLTAEASIDAGIGPICAEKWGL